MIDAILCSDIHLRDSIPVARIDDYWLAQEKKIKFISDLQKEHDCLIFCAGDIFHKAKSSQYLEAWAIDFLPPMTCIAGQHDLPNHNFENLNKSSLGVLQSAGIVNVLNIPFGDIGVVYEIKNKKIAMTHRMILKPDDKQDKIIGGMDTIKLLKKYPEYDLILTGDNHKSFTVEHEGRLLVNPGSMMRMTAGQINHKPRVYLWDAEKNEVEIVYLPIEKDVISREHIEIQKEKDAKIEAFINRMKQDYEIDISFDSNMKSFLQSNEVRPSVEKIIWEEMRCQ